MTCYSSALILACYFPTQPECFAIIYEQNKKYLIIVGSSTSSKRRSSSSRSTHIVSSVNNSSVSTSSFCYDSKFLLSDMCLQQYIEQLKLILKDNGLKTESLGKVCVSLKYTYSNKNLSLLLSTKLLWFVLKNV